MPTAHVPENNGTYHFVCHEYITATQVYARQDMIAYLKQIHHDKVGCCTGGTPTSYLTKILNMQFATLVSEYERVKTIQQASTTI